MAIKRELERQTIGLELSTESGRGIFPFVVCIDRVVRLETFDGIESVTENIERGKTWHPQVVPESHQLHAIWAAGDVAFRVAGAVWQTLMRSAKELGR